jgi:hypothetical protein
MASASSFTSIFTAVSRFLQRELAAAWPVFLFFLTGFSLMILLIKLALARFSIEVSLISNALVGALIAAKAALILDETSLARHLEHYRRVVAVCVKTAIYGSASLALGYLERYLEALHRTHSAARALGDVMTHGNHDVLFAWALGISIVFAAYFSLVEINQKLGTGELVKLFFESPRIARGTVRSSDSSS